MNKFEFYKKYNKEELEKTMLMLCDFDSILPEKNKKENSLNITTNTINLLNDLVMYMKKNLKK